MYHKNFVLATSAPKSFVGPIPHFHIINKDGTFEVCVRIYENMYYSHEGKYYNILNYKQCKKLNEFLRNYNDKFYKFTNWWLIHYIWSGTDDNDNYNLKSWRQYTMMKVILKNGI